MQYAWRQNKEHVDWTTKLSDTLYMIMRKKTKYERRRLLLFVLFVFSNTLLVHICVCSVYNRYVYVFIIIELLILLSYLIVQKKEDKFISRKIYVYLHKLSMCDINISRAPFLDSKKKLPQVSLYHLISFLLIRMRAVDNNNSNNDKNRAETNINVHTRQKSYS